MGHIGNAKTIEDTVGGMSDGLVKTMLSHPDRTRTDIEFTDIDRIQGGIPGLRAPRKEVFFPNKVIMEDEVGNILRWEMTFFFNS